MSLGSNPYARGAFVEKLRTSGIVMATDIDGTISSGDDNPSQEELADRAAVFELADKVGAMTVGVSARSPALMMSKEVFLESKARGLTELEPRWVKREGKYVSVDLKDLPYFTHVIDRFDSIASVGGGILVRNGKGYIPDLMYDKMLNVDYLADITAKDEEYHMPWKQALNLFLFDKCMFATPFMAPIEFLSNYYKREVNVSPLNYRAQFNFPGSKGLQVMQKLLRILKVEGTKPADTDDPSPRLARRIQAVCESRIIEDDPEKSMHVLYLLPWQGRKENMLNRILTQSSAVAGRMLKDTRTFFAGDTRTDLYAGLYGGGDAETTFCLAKGSRLAPYIINRKSCYGTEDLSFLWANPMRGNGRARDRLVATGSKGEYRFVHKTGRHGRIVKRENLIIIADERYSEEKTAAGSVRRFLEEYMV